MLPSMHEAGGPYLLPDQFGRYYAQDYFQRSPRLWRQKKWLVWLPVGLCSVWLALECFGQNWTTFQAGPVSAVALKPQGDCHAAFNLSCTRCHTEHFQTWKRLFPWNAPMHTVPDTGCVACHRESLLPGERLYPQLVFQAGKELEGRPAPPHHFDQAAPPACAKCHREHRGQASLTLVKDEQCTTCHADLSQVARRPTPFLNVNDFGKSHPELGVVRRQEPDRARLRFNHAAHLDLEKEFGLGLDPKLLPLDCKHCHQPDPKTNGHFMRPINYKDHCCQCHPLSISIVGESLGPDLGKAVQQFAGKPAPHKEPADIRQALRERLKQFAENHPAILTKPLFAQPQRPIPGKPVPSSVPADKTAWLKHQQGAAERRLFSGAGGCRFCHEPAKHVLPGELPDYQKTNLPDRWLHHSLFNHAAQGHQDCTVCHAAARKSQATHDVLLPSIDVCRTCHAPGKTARFDCRECHRYHSQDLKNDLAAGIGPLNFTKASGGRQPPNFCPGKIR